MDKLNGSIKLLLYIFMIMIGFLVLFRLNNWVDDRKVSDKKKPSKNDNTIKKIDKVDSSASNIVTLKPEIEKNDSKPSIDGESVISTPYTNYLHDRFVTSPTKEDDVYFNPNISSAFLSEDEIEKIRNTKVRIRVKEDDKGNQDNPKEVLYNKIEKMTNENVATKEKILKEFESLSREMKLLLIENIMQRID